MSNLPELCIVDTNVPVTANKKDQELELCILSCREAIQHVTSSRTHLVIDIGDDIYYEYMHNLSMSGCPGIGDHFMKWVHDNRFMLPERNRVSITKEDDSYKEFPKSEDLADFDPSDWKFIALANAHKKKPTILQAVDSKWWGAKEKLKNTGIKVLFLCEKYVKEKYEKKFN